MNILTRNFDINSDKSFIIECHCRINYHCDSEWAIKKPYREYREKYYSTNQPDEFWQVLVDSVGDKRNIIGSVE